jgi:hypothetical protein
MSHYETKMLEAVESIALSLSRIANKMCLGHVPDVPQKHSATVETTHSLAADYDAAVAALKAIPDDIPAPAPKGKPATKEDVVKALNTFSRVHGVAAAKGVLAQFGATLGDVPEEKYGELVALLAVTQ